MSTTAGLPAPPDSPTLVHNGRPIGAEPTGSGNPRRIPRRSVKPLLLRLHFYAGILVAPFLVVAAVTGLLYTFTPQLDRIVYPQELTVTKVGATSRPLAEQVAAARATHPQGTLVAVQPGASEATTQVDFALPELGDKSHTIYVDPYTGQVTGQLTTWYGTTPLKTWLDDLHRNLHLGAVGRHYSELAASWLWILALGGVILWWRRHRSARTARRLLAPDLAANKGVRRTRGWHAATGVWLTTGLLILSATGLTWSRYAGAHFSAALGAVRSGTPEVSTSLTSASIPAAGAHHHGGAEDSAATASVNPTAIDSVLAGGTPGRPDRSSGDRRTEGHRHRLDRLADPQPVAGRP
jgi:uncharacterized iron-regulated membrane protein